MITYLTNRVMVLNQTVGCLALIVTLVACHPKQTRTENESYTYQSLEDTAAVIEENSNVVFEGEYCTRLLVKTDNGSIIGDYDVNVKTEANNLIWLDLPAELSIDFSSYEPALIDPEGHAEITMEDGRTYSIQIIECKERVSSDESDEVLEPDLAIVTPKTYSGNSSWAKDHLLEYFEKGELRKYINLAEGDFETLQTEADRDEAKSIINFANSFISSGIVSVDDFNKATGLLGLSYTEQTVNGDLSIVKFNFGKEYYYFMKNTNRSAGYSYSVIGKNGKLVLMKSSRNVACSNLSGFMDGKIEYSNIQVVSAEPMNLCF